MTLLVSYRFLSLHRQNVGVNDRLRQYSVGGIYDEE